MLKRLCIQQFRGFYARQTFEFAVPDGVNNGSGLSIIVGPNNAGKTTFIEALSYHSDTGNQKRFNDSERHHSRSPVITLTDTEGRTEKITNINQGSQIEFVDNVHLSAIKIEFIASRRQWQAQYNGSLTHEQFAGGSSNVHIRNQGDPGTAQRLATINMDVSQRTELTHLMTRLVPSFSFWTVGTREPAGDFIKYKTKSGTEHAVDMLGDGIISLFRICAHLVGNAANTVLVIDEPELSLHPWAQKELHAILSECAKSKQVIVVTHSPHFVDWADYANGAKIIRLNKPGDKACIVSSLKRTSAYTPYLAASLNDWQKPEILDAVAKEIMFSEKVLFVEGKEDLGLLRKWVAENSFSINFDIFGYGVGGETQMKLFLELSKDLGLVKAAALFDGNATTYAACVRDYPNYLVRKLSTDDIRDKFNGVMQIRVGIFDRHGVIKSSHESELRTLLTAYNDYFGT